ncbi:hypothetical protein QJS04_geneDACA006665 [Acorus gramineus]|uniref:Uncharacterized protein n=1 Tax=Acorus gramineus TaxID=55184 RepID=A0AAV9AWZ9_ACOGR|nr:hypothetical protein QJS04_geneDACA006665 [Acorus gramineus]
MEVSMGFLSMLWSFLSFLPIFLLLLILGIIKAAIIGPIVATIILVGNSAVIIGLWPAHFVWTYYCIAKTKRLGWVLKTMALLSLPMPLLTWPIFGIIGSLLLGIGYGYFAPLIATFEAIGEQVVHKLIHCFTDGCVSTMKGSCTVVRDFTDFCFHSYFSLMDDLREKVSEDEKPIDLKLSRLPSCFVIGTLAVLLDVPIITALALGKSPYMLFKGWQRLLEDLIGREGPFLETVCVPFAGLAIILWPLAVVAAVISAFFCSFFLSLYSVIIVYQEKSLKMGFAYMVSVVSLFDEYANDQLYLREGTCLPRPKYRKHTPLSESVRRRQQYDLDSSTILSSNEAKLVSKRSKTLKTAIRQLKPVQIWDWLFRSCELNGKFLLREGLIEVSDIQECLLKGKCKKLSIRLPAWCVFQCLLRSAKSDADGLLISMYPIFALICDEVELTNFNWPKDKVLEWFLGPLLIMKEQIKGLQLSDNEEACLGKLIMTHNSQRPDDWNDSGFPSNDNVRRAQLQAIIRRLQGIVASMSRMPTFRRRFNNLVKSLYVEAIETGAIVENGGSSRSKGKINMSVHNANENNVTDEFEMV